MPGSMLCSLCFMLLRGGSGDEGTKVQLLRLVVTATLSKAYNSANHAQVSPWAVTLVQSISGCQRPRRRRNCTQSSETSEGRAHTVCAAQGGLPPEPNWLCVLDTACPKIVIESAAFDTQKLKAEEAGLQKPQGTNYQHCDQTGFWNVRECVLF